MRCLQHVLWRGAMALGLLAFGGVGAMALPQPATPACVGAALARAATGTHVPRVAVHAAESRDPAQPRAC